MRLAQRMRGRVRLLALTSSPARRAELRAQGLTPLLGNLDDAASLRRLAGLATRVVHLAPPPSEGHQDPRTQALIRALRQRKHAITPPITLVYGSTSGVYGDCAGDWVDETRAIHPETARAQRRADAETRLRRWGRGLAVRISILRIPGIYAADRDGGTPRTRLLKGLAVLRSEDDVYTNHIHADDLARAALLALWRGAAQRVYNVNDDSQLKMGDYFDMAADLYGLPRPPRITREVAAETMPAMQLSFMRESRRMRNTRMKKELRLRLLHPTVMGGLR